MYVRTLSEGGFCGLIAHTHIYTYGVHIIGLEYRIYICVCDEFRAGVCTAPQRVIVGWLAFWGQFLVADLHFTNVSYLLRTWWFMPFAARTHATTPRRGGNEKEKSNIMDCYWDRSMSYMMETERGEGRGREGRGITRSAPRVLVVGLDVCMLSKYRIYVWMDGVKPVELGKMRNDGQREGSGRWEIGDSREMRNA